MRRVETADTDCCGWVFSLTGVIFPPCSVCKNEDSWLLFYCWSETDNKGQQRRAEGEEEVWWNVLDGAKRTLSLTPLAPPWLLIEIQPVKMMNRRSLTSQPSGNEPFPDLRSTFRVIRQTSESLHLSVSLSSGWRSRRSSSPGFCHSTATAHEVHIPVEGRVSRDSPTTSRTLRHSSSPQVSEAA